MDLLKALFHAFFGSGSSKPHPHDGHSIPQPSFPHAPENILQSDSVASLRAKANAEGDQMARCFRESHEAYARGDGAAAKALSNEGKTHQQSMECFNKRASRLIFNENNKHRLPGEIDLHGLYVKEAIAYTDDALEKAKQEGATELRLIVGKGLHSTGGNAKIKPAIEELMQKHRLHVQMDPANAGVLIVRINSGSGRGVGAAELVQSLEEDDRGCVVM